MNNVLTIILAGGKGSRLEPLTRDRAKPAVPFGGGFRIIDFALSNCLNSGLRKLLVLTQYKARSLDRHINEGWRRYFCSDLNEFIDIVPPQQRIDENWYQGTADAVYQNIYSIEQAAPEYVVILAGDHIYKMNYGRMIEQHKATGADLTIGALEVSKREAEQFGVMQVDDQYRVVGFDEKPMAPKTIPGRDDVCLASMGIYVFSARFMFEQLLRDANDPESVHDFGKNIIPSIINSDRVFAFPFVDENRKDQSYWRDVGTLDAYYNANMDLIRADPQLNVYDLEWPIRTHVSLAPPPKFVFGSSAADVKTKRIGCAIDSIVSSGSIISGGMVQRCVISPNVRVNSFAEIKDSILFEGVDIGRHCKIQRAIIDKNVKIPAGTEIGFDAAKDRAAGFEVTEQGVVVIGKSQIISNPGKLPIHKLTSGPKGQRQRRSRAIEIEFQRDAE